MSTFSQAHTVFSELINQAQAVAHQWQAQAQKSRQRGAELEHALRTELDARWAHLTLDSLDTTASWAAPLATAWSNIEIRQNQAIEQAASCDPESDKALGEAEEERQRQADALLWHAQMRLEHNGCERALRNHARRFGATLPGPGELAPLPGGVGGWLRSWFEPTATRHLRRTIRRFAPNPEAFWGQVAQAAEDRAAIPDLERTVRQARGQAHRFFAQARLGQDLKRQVLQPSAVQQLKNKSAWELFERMPPADRRSHVQDLLDDPLKADTWLFTEQQVKACHRLSDQARSGEVAAKRVSAQLSPTRDKLAKATRSGRGHRTLPASFNLAAISTAVAAALAQIKAPQATLADLLSRLENPLDVQDVQSLRTAAMAQPSPTTAPSASSSSSASTDAALFWLWLRATPGASPTAFEIPTDLGGAVDLAPSMAVPDCSWSDLSNLSLPDVSVDTGSSFDPGSSYDSGLSCGGGDF